MDAPVLSRWWHVGQGDRHLLEHWDAWKELAGSIINTWQQNTNQNELASYLDKYMREDGLRA
jgi:hypothetical protein